MSVVVSDTSPLHYLILCDAVEVLRHLFQEVVIPPTVFQELQQPKTPDRVRAWLQAVPEWVRVQAPTKLDPSLEVDPGEREAICLALEIKAAAILIDDRAGRSAALRYGLAVTGTLGVLELAAGRGVVDLPKVLDKLRATNVRLDAQLVEGALKRDAARRQQERGGRKIRRRDSGS